jgi:hypothetical protein
VQNERTNTVTPLDFRGNKKRDDKMKKAFLQQEAAWGIQLIPAIREEGGTTLRERER